MFFLTGSFFLVELIGGLMLGSLALVADAMHMLSDLIALAIGFFSVRVLKFLRYVFASVISIRLQIESGLALDCFFNVCTGSTSSRF